MPYPRSAIRKKKKKKRNLFLHNVFIKLEQEKRKIKHKRLWFSSAVGLMTAGNRWINIHTHTHTHLAAIHKKKKRNCI